MTARQQAQAKFHLTERDGRWWLAAQYEKDGPHPGAANRRLRDLGSDREYAEAVLADFQRRLP